MWLALVALLLVWVGAMGTRQAAIGAWMGLK